MCVRKYLPSCHCRVQAISCPRQTQESGDLLFVGQTSNDSWAEGLMQKGEPGFLSLSPPPPLSLSLSLSRLPWRIGIVVRHTRPHWDSRVVTLSYPFIISYEYWATELLLKHCGTSTRPLWFYKSRERQLRPSPSSHSSLIFRNFPRVFHLILSFWVIHCSIQRQK